MFEHHIIQYMQQNINVRTIKVFVNFKNTTCFLNLFKNFLSNVTGLGHNGFPKSRWDTHNITVVRCLNLTLFFSFARTPPLNSELRSTTQAWRRGRMIDYFYLN